MDHEHQDTSASDGERAAGRVSPMTVRQSDYREESSLAHQRTPDSVVLGRRDRDATGPSEYKTRPIHKVKEIGRKFLH